MALDFGKGMLFGDGGIFNNTNTKTQIEKIKILSPIFAQGFTNDCDIQNFVMTFPSHTEDKKVLGYSVYFSITNASGASDAFYYQIQNSTKSVTLGTFGISIANNNTFGKTRHYTIEEITPGDSVQIIIFNGIIGTDASAQFMGQCTFHLTTIQEGTIDDL